MKPLLRRRYIFITKSIGFTLLEILVAMLIVGILSGVAIPLYADYKEKAMIARACADIQTISTVISTFYTEHLQYPASLNQVGFGTFLDPWGNPYQYINIQTACQNCVRKNKFMHPINTDYDLCSMGKDGQTAHPLTAKASKDDIIRANDGAYIGLVSNF